LLGRHQLRVGVSRNRPVASALALPGVARAHHPPIVFESNRDGNLEIYRMNADGSAPTMNADGTAHQKE